MKRSVLLVEDSADQALFVRSVLEAAGWDVRHAGEGRGALEEVGRELPDIVVTDLRMPGMDGLQLVDELAARHARLPVVLITAFGNETIATEALRRGALSYIPKSRIAEDLAPTLLRVAELVQCGRERTRVLACLRRSSQEFELPNDTALIAPLVRLVEEALESRFGEAHQARIFHAGMALSEALTNAMHHGNLGVASELRVRDHGAYRALIEQRRREDPFRNRLVRVGAEIGDDRFACRVRDEGTGYPESALQCPADPANLTRPSGRGLFLISTFMDQVTFSEDRTEVRMELGFPREGAGSG